MTAGHSQPVNVIHDFVDLRGGQNLVLAEWRHGRVGVGARSGPELSVQIFSIRETCSHAYQWRSDIGIGHRFRLSGHGMTCQTISLAVIESQFLPSWLRLGR